jgi:hypothetical protein
MTVADVLKLLEGQWPLVVVSVLILYGGAKRIWVWGYQLKDMTQDRDEWKARALRSVGLVERTVTVLEQTTPQVGK